MKTFIAYRFTGEDPKDLGPIQEAIRSGFLQRGVEAYSTFFDEEDFLNKSMNARQIMDHAFQKIDDSDFLFVILTSDNKSEGMLMEIGYCIAKKIPIIVAVKSSAGSTYVPDMAELSFKWDSVDDLRAKIEDLNLEGME